MCQRVNHSVALLRWQRCSSAALLRCSAAAVQRCFMWSPLALWTRICWAGTGWDEDSRPLCEALEGEQRAAAQAASLQVLGYRSLGKLTHSADFAKSSLRFFYLKIYMNEISRFEQALANRIEQVASIRSTLIPACGHQMLIKRLRNARITLHSS